MKRASFTVFQPGLILGLALAYLGLIVLLPISAAVVKSTTLSGADFWAAISSPRAVASYKLTFGSAFLAAALNTVMGFLVAWVLVRIPFPGRRLADAMVDLPFALPTAVAGIALAGLYAPDGWIGQLLAPMGLRIAYQPAGVFVALVFIGLPFVVRTIQPVLEELDPAVEESAACLGASRGATFAKIIFPALAPSLLTGFAMAFARGIGEYGSVIFIAGNLPMKSEIASLLIVSRLEQYDYAGASALAVTLLGASFLLLLLINWLQNWTHSRHENR
ncbi:MAG: sulfate ABC transporter permease subunit CysT [Kiritimatiellia bacterium]